MFQQFKMVQSIRKSLKSLHSKSKKCPKVHLPVKLKVRLPFFQFLRLHAPNEYSPFYI